MTHDRVTFLFTDIEGSTRLLQDLGDRYTALVNVHHDIVQTACARHHVVRLEPSGDGFFALFASAGDALHAAVDIQRALAAEEMGGAAVRVRMGVHSVADSAGSTAAMRLDMHRAGRIMSAGHGGQILVSEATRTALGGTLPEGASFRDLGTHQMKDLVQPEHLYQVVIPGLPSEFPPLLSVSARPHNLPLQLTTFVGRDREMAELGRLMGRSRLVTLTGPGGAGKTRLALQLGAAALDRFPDGVWLIELAPVQDAGLVVAAVAGALRLREQAGQRLLETVVAYLQGKTLLVIVDNCEHLIAAAADMADTLLRRASGITILATSREPLAVGGEQVVRVRPLGLPDPRAGAVETLLKSDAVRLFVDRASSSFPDFQLDERTARAVAQICHRLDGIPLALELAAARIPALTPQEIASGLDDRFHLLTSGSRTAAGRHQTLQAVMDWSHDLLTPTERVLFGRLAVFSGGWSASAAVAVCAGDGLPAPAVLATLVRLVDRSLVTFQSQATGTRYAFLESVRAYAAERLGESGEGAPIRTHHLDYMLAFVEQAEPHLKGPEQAEWLDRLHAEHDNLRAGLEWALSGPVSPELALRLARAPYRFWEVRGYLSEGRQFLERALALAADVQPQLRSEALRALGNLAYWQNDFAAARSFHERCLTLKQQIGDIVGIAAALSNLGIVASTQGRYDEARPLLEESLALFRASGTPYDIGIALNNLGNVTYFQGDLAAARALYEESLAVRRQQGDLRGIGSALNNLGNLAFVQGDYEAAQRLHEECLAVVRRVGDQAAIGASLCVLANLAYLGGDLAASQRLHLESLAVRLDASDQEGIAESYEGIAKLAAALGRPEDAAHLFGAASALRSSIGVPMAPAERPAHEIAVNALSAEVGDEQFRRAFRKGEEATPPETATLAQRVLEGTD